MCYEVSSNGTDDLPHKVSVTLLLSQEHHCSLDLPLVYIALSNQCLRSWC